MLIQQLCAKITPKSPEIQCAGYGMRRAMGPLGQKFSDPPRAKREQNILRMVQATVAVGGSNKKARAIAGAGLDSGAGKFIPAENKSVLSDSSIDSTV